MMATVVKYLKIYHPCQIILTFYSTGEQKKILQNLSCSSSSLVYLINCKRCIEKDLNHPCQYIV